MGMGSGIVTTAGKLWVYPVFGLVLVGAPALAIGYSDGFANGLGATGGIVVSDLPDLIQSFKDNLSGTLGGGEQAPPTTEAPVTADATG